MAKCFDVVGYVEPCNAVRKKYTGRALLIACSAGKGGVVFDFEKNGVAISGLNTAKSFDVFKESFDGKLGSLLPISINVENPFGVTVQGNTDSGRVSYTKTIPVSIPAIRDGNADDFILGLTGNTIAPVYIALEVSGYEDLVSDFFGAYSTIRIDPTSVTRSEYENGGAWTFNIVCEEPVPNVTCGVTGLASLLNTLNV